MRFIAYAVLPALAAVALSLPQSRSQDGLKGPPDYFVVGNIYTGKDDAPFKRAGMEIKNGKIVAIVDSETAMNLVTRPPTRLVGHPDAVVIPGLVDTHSHIGLYAKPGVAAHSDGNEMTGPVQPGIRAVDAIWPDDPGIRMATAGGVTTANIMPGSGNVIGGQTLYVKLRGKTVEEMRVTGKLADGTEILGGLKMANGENPKGYGRTKQQAPFTRMKVAALQREQFVKTKQYMAKMAGDKKPDRDVALEPLVEVLQKKRTVHFHCHRADDLMTAVRIAEEFGFELVLQHATEGYRVADVLARKKLPVSLTLIDSPGGKAEVMGLLEENAAALDKAGVTVTINTDDSVTESRFYLRTGAIAVRGGMSEAAALRALTLNAAKVLHLDHRVGSLEVGKDADFAILSGPPFSVYTKVLETWIDGKKVFDAGSEQDRPYRDGGFALPRGIEAPKGADIADRPQPLATAGDEGTFTKAAAGRPTVIFANRVHTGAGTVLAEQVIVVENGRIKSIAGLRDAVIPKDVNKLTCVEVTPGLIDPFTSAGLSGAWNIPADQDQDEPSDPNQADLRVLDGFNPHEPLLEYLRSNGITVAHVTPGRQAVIAGTSGVFRTGGGTIEASALNTSFALLVNLGEVPKDTFKAKGPATRMAVAGLVRKAFAEAQAKASGGRQPPEGSPEKGDRGTDAPRSPKTDALLAALDGKVPVVFAAHRADDIRTALRLADEFKLKPIIALGTEAYLVADELAARKVPVIVHPTMQRAGGSMETLNTVLANAAALKAKGVSVTICSGFEGYVPKNRNIRWEAAMAAVNGLGHAAALRAITLDAAKLLGIDKDRGSVEVGKVADLVLYDGDPFEHATHVTHTVMGGTIVFDRGEYLKLPFERRILPIVSGGGGGVGCCLGW